MSSYPSGLLTTGAWGVGSSRTPEDTGVSFTWSGTGRVLFSSVESEELLIINF